MLEQNKLDTFYHACIDGNFEVIKGFLEQKENREDLLDYQDFHVWKMVCASNLRVNILNYLIEVSTEKDRDRAFADNIHKLLKSACQFNYKDIFDTLINAIPSSQLSSVLKQNNHELLQIVCRYANNENLDKLLQKYPDQKMIDEGLLTLDINEISHLGHDEILESLKKFDKNKKLNNVDSKASLFLNIIKAQPAPPFFTKKQPEPQQPKESKKRVFGFFK